MSCSTSTFQVPRYATKYLPVVRTRSTGRFVGTLGTDNVATAGTNEIVSTPLLPVHVLCVAHDSRSRSSTTVPVERSVVYT